MHAFTNRPSSFRLVTLLLLAGGAMPAIPVAGADFCQNWTAVYETANRGFRKWRGAYDQTLQEYTSNIFFPNAKTCTVEEDEFDFEFYCGWHYAPSEVDRARSDALALSGGIRQCLSTKRKRGRTSAGSDTDTHGVMLWRDEIPDNEDEALSTVVTLYQRNEWRLKSGRTLPPSLTVAVRITFSR